MTDAQRAPSQQGGVARSPGRGVGSRETLALLMLSVGSVLCSVLGWLVGVVLLWTSPKWTTREKWVGTLILPGGLAPAVFFTFSFGGYTCESSSFTGPNGVTQTRPEVCDGQVLPIWAAWLIVSVLVLAPVITSIWLAVRASRRSFVGDLRPTNIGTGTGTRS
jgi:hypothetical protein